MTKIETNSSSLTTGYAVSAAQAAAPRFSGAMREAQVLPRSAYVPSGEPYDRDKHGSHRVGDVELVPGAPGYDFDRALPRLKEIAATDRQLASYLSGKGIQVGPAMPETLPVEVEPVVIADPALQAALDEIENALAAETSSAVTDATASTASNTPTTSPASTTVTTADAATNEATDTAAATNTAAATTDAPNSSDTASSAETITQNVAEASSLATSTETTSAVTEQSTTAAASETAATDIAVQTALQAAPETLLVTSARYLSQHMELNLASSLMDSAEVDVTQTA
jgi:hypothetical protein